MSIFSKLKNILKNFKSSKKQGPVDIVPDIELKNISEQINEEGYLELSFENLSANIVIHAPGAEEAFEIITENDAAEYTKMQQLGKDNEIFAKKDIYALSISRDEHLDKADATQNRLKEAGYTIVELSPEQAKTQGVFIQALVPSNPSAPITILSRGTKFPQLDPSFIQDLDPRGPGYSVIEENRTEILSRLEAILADYPERTLRLTGHSLGGSLSQLLTDAVLDIKAQAILNSGDTQFSNIAKVTGIETILFQTAGVSQAVADRAKVNLTAVKNSCPEFDMTLLANIDPEDLVTKTGIQLFGDVDPELAHVLIRPLFEKTNRGYLSLGDILDIGFSATMAGPVWGFMTTIKNLLSRQAANKQEAHCDYFYHDPKDGYRPIEQKVNYGYYSNQNPSERAYIKAVFDENILDKSPSFIQNMQERFFNRAKKLEATEVSGLLDGGLALASGLSNLAYISGKTITSPLAGMCAGVKYANKLTDDFNTVQESIKPAIRGFWKLKA